MPDWKTLLDEHGPAVWRTAYRLLGSHNDADDCYQDAFADALNWIERGKPAIRQWRPFLMRIVTARAMDRLRSRYSRARHENATSDLHLAVDAARGSMPHHKAESDEQFARLRGWIADLPPKQAEAFCLHCLEDLSYRDVAESLATSVDHVGVLISRARAALRQRVAEQMTEQSLAKSVATANLTPKPR